MIKNAAPETAPVKANEITDAKIGPTHGVQINPKLIPTTNPPPKPCCSPFGENLEKNVNKTSSFLVTAGIKRLSPNPTMTTTEKVRRASADSPVAETIVDKNSVKNVKLAIKPVTIPSGRFVPSPTDPDSTIGKTGRIHGDKIVTTPAKMRIKVK